MKMHNPPHPGKILRELCLKPLGLTVTESAEALGVSRKTLSTILNGRAGISPEMANKEDRLVVRVTPDETFYTPPVHLNAGEDASKLEHGYGQRLPW